MRAVVMLVALCLVSPVLGKPSPPKYVEMDRKAVQLYADGWYADAAKIWRYIHEEYPRDDLRGLPASDPRFVAWQKIHYAAIVRQGMAEGKAKGGTKGETIARRAETLARQMMARNSRFTPAQQEAVIEAAKAPLLK